MYEQKANMPKCRDNWGGYKGRYQYDDHDEYYTPFTTVETIFKRIGPHLRGKKVLFPCDSEQSAFVQYAQKNAKYWGFEWKNSAKDFRDNKEDLEWCNVVITNPPFSLLADFMEFIEEKDCAFVCSSINLGRVIRRRLISSFYISGKFLRPSGLVKNIGSVICCNSFGECQGPISYACDSPAYEYEDNTGIPILNNIRQFPRYENAPPLLWVPASAYVYDLSGYELLKTSNKKPNLRVNGKAKYLRFLISKLGF